MSVELNCRTLCWIDGGLVVSVDKIPRAKLLQSCWTLCEPMDYSPPGSSVSGILQAKILDCVAMPFSRRSS